MAEFEARLKPQFAKQYEGLNSVTWYEVAPLWAGVTERATNLLGQRLARLKGPREPVTVLAEHVEFRERPARGSGKVKKRG